MPAPEKTTVAVSAKKKRRPMLIAGLVLMSLILVAALVPAGFLLAMNDRVLPGVMASGVKLGGLTREAAGVRLNAEAAIFENQGANFTDGKRTVHLEALAFSPSDPDASFDLYSLNMDAAAEAAFAVGHRGSVWQRITEASTALWHGWSVPILVSFDDARLAAALRNIWSADEKPVVDAKLNIVMNGNAFVSAMALPDKAGMEFDYSRAVSDFKDHITSLDKSDVALQTAATQPRIRTADVTALITEVPSALKIAPLALTADEWRWKLEAADIAAMLQAQIDAYGRPALGISDAAAAAYFKKIAADYDIAASDTHFEIDPETRKLTVFEPGRDGRKIDIERTVAALKNALANELVGSGSADFNVVTIVAKSQAVTESAADLGIKEILGIGRSDFSGSSNNRIKNIKHGSSKLNGLLIAPNEEFSLINALNPVTLEDGYFPEQIILGDRIKLDVGGGLCQIGTTTFRAAMNSGLPIVERQNHSLVVHYYADPLNGNPGTDATVFGPHPDVRFKNDTGHWILFTTEINVPKKALTYTLWGTSDGRHGSYSPPKVLRWIPAPTETQTTETADLKPGEQKCQNAFRGADTIFTYTIANADGTVTAREFPSHYRALPKICMVGAQPATPETTNNQEPISNSNTNSNSNINTPSEAALGN